MSKFGLLPDIKGDKIYEYCKDGKVNKLEGITFANDLLDYSIKTEIASMKITVKGIDYEPILLCFVGKFKYFGIYPNYFTSETVAYNEKKATYFKSLCGKIIGFYMHNTLTLTYSNTFTKNKLFLLGEALELGDRFWVGINSLGKELIDNTDRLRQSIVNYLDLTLVNDTFDGYEFRRRSEKLWPYENSDFSYEEFVLMFWSVAFKYVEKNHSNVSCEMKFSHHYELWVPKIIYEGFKIDLIQSVREYLEQLGGDKDRGLFGKVADIFYDIEDYGEHRFAKKISTSITER